MEQDALVYIILVNFNSKVHTVECIESLEKITYKNYKIIVVDNASSDDSQEVITKQFPEVIWIQNSENTGFADANNCGIQYALKHGTQYVLLLNNDTTVDKSFLEHLVDAYESDSSIGIATGKILYYQNHSIVWYAGGFINHWKGSSDAVGYGKEDTHYNNRTEYCTFASGCCMLISAQAIKCVGLMDNSYFLYYEDLDYCTRFFNMKYKILYCEEAVIYHKESVTTRKSSPLFTYYLVRNRLLYIKENNNMIYRWGAYIYSLAWFTKKAVHREMQVKYIVWGVKDAILGRKGKWEENAL